MGKVLYTVQNAEPSRSAWEIDTLQLMLLDKNGKPEKAAWLKHPKLL